MLYLNFFFVLLRMNETGVDGEEYLSYFYSLCFIYTFLYE